MEKIVYSKEVLEYLDQLVYTLFEKENFGFMDSSIEYVLKILDEIENNIFSNQYKQSPQKLINKGKYYTSYSSTKHTTWYIIFEKRNDKILITYIFNNHCIESKYL